MNKLTRLLTTSALAALIAVGAGCGGTEEDVADATAAARGGKVPAATGSITVTPGVVSLGQELTISLYPGSHADGRLFLNWACYQNGALVSHDGTYELHEAVAYGIPGYADLGDHFDWKFTFEALQSYTGGEASCEVSASYVDRKGQWFRIASGSFAAQ